MVATTDAFDDLLGAAILTPRGQTRLVSHPPLRLQASIATSESRRTALEPMSGLSETAGALSRDHTTASASFGSSSPTASPKHIKSEGGRGRKRTLEGSNEEASQEDKDDGDGDGDGDGSEGKRRLPGVKRACNQCRQQKVSRDN